MAVKEQEVLLVAEVHQIGASYLDPNAKSLFDYLGNKLTLSWQPVTLNGAFETASNTLEVALLGGSLLFRGGIKKTSGNLAQNDEMFTLPAGYQTSRQVELPVMSYVSGAPGLLYMAAVQFQNTGKCLFKEPANLTADGDTIRFDGMSIPEPS